MIKLHPKYLPHVVRMKKDKSTDERCERLWLCPCAISICGQRFMGPQNEQLRIHIISKIDMSGRRLLDVPDPERKALLWRPITN